jgi:hypothetical protein
MIIQTLRPGEKEALLGAEWSYVPPTGGLTNSTADVVAKTAVAAKRNYVTKIRLLTSTALANVSYLEVKSAATVLDRIHLPVNVPGILIDYGNKPLIGGVNEAINFATPTVFATGILGVAMWGYTI